MNMPPLRVRDAQPSDLPRLHPWLGPLAQRALPPAPAPGADAARAERWWVAVDAADQAQAALRLRPAIGLDADRAWYHLGCVVHASAALGLFNRQPRLLLGNDLCGAAELADVAWDRSATASTVQAALNVLVQAALTALTALTAPTTAAGWPAGAARRVLVEVPGCPGTGANANPNPNPDTDGPFWAGLGRAFCRTSPSAAVARLGPAWQGPVAALLPRQPVYLSFLSGEAQAAAGQADPAAAPLLVALQAAGFAAGEHITVHDGGPVWELQLPA